MKSIFIKKELRSIKTRLRALKETIKTMENNRNKEKVKEIKNITFKEEIKEKTELIPNEEKETKSVQINKKEEIKITILKIIQEENLTGTEIKQKIVDHERICSKASFYRYIQELKKEGKIESLNINNQEFLYSKK